MERHFLALEAFICAVVGVAGVIFLAKRFDSYLECLGRNAQDKATLLLLYVCASLATVLFAIQKRFSDASPVGQLIEDLTHLGLAGCVFFGLVLFGSFLFLGTAKQTERNKPSKLPKIILEKTAWPEQPIDQYQNAKGKLGYLVIYADNSFEFRSSETPTEKEIYERWGHYLHGYKAK